MITSPYNLTDSVIDKIIAGVCTTLSKMTWAEQAKTLLPLGPDDLKRIADYSIEHKFGELTGSVNYSLEDRSGYIKIKKSVIGIR